MKFPILHGEADNNSGTFPIQSDRLYRARESVMHTLWEQDRWLEEYVKNAPPRQTSN